MKKLTTFLSLLMLFLGTGTTWAGYSESNGVKTWDFTTGFDATAMRNAGFVQDGTSHRYTWTTTSWGQESTLAGLDGLKFDGSFQLYDNAGNNMRILSGTQLSIGIPAAAGNIVVVTGYYQSGARGATWTGLETAPTTQFANGTATALGGIADGSGYVGINNNTEREFRIDKIQVYTNAPTMSFSESSKNLELIDLDFTEPNLTSSNIPDAAVLSFRPSNWALARVVYPYDGTGVAGDADGKGKYDVMAVHKGTGSIIAEYKIADVVIASAQFGLTIEADDYLWEVTPDGKTFTITGVGGVPDRVIDQVAFIEMQFGDAAGTTNLPIVRNYSEGLVATILDENGWRHVWMSDGTNKDRNGNTVPANQPFQGTFYIFKPQLDGNLTLNMAVTSTNKAQIVDANALTTAVATFDNSSTCRDYTVSVLGGHTYYVYANTPATPFNTTGAWSVAELHAFTFEPTAGYFEYKGLVYKDGKLYDPDGVERFTSARQPLVGSSNVEYTLIETLGDASASINSSTGELTIDETKGGAIAVGAKINGENMDYYMITVPYTTHDWFFTESVSSPSKITHNDYTQTAWSFTYKVSRPDKNTRKYKELKDAVLCNARNVTGNNAAFLGQTAGLVFKSSAKRFGTNTGFNFDDYNAVLNNREGLGDGYEDALHAIITDYVYNRGIDNLRDEDMTSFVTMATHSSLIIPNLKKGQYVRIWWRRHAGGNSNGNEYTNGDLYSATNVTDLAGTPITNNFYIGNGAGYQEFIVQNDGDVSFTLELEGGNETNELIAWSEIFRVTVGEVNEFLDTNLTTRIGTDQVRSFTMPLPYNENDQPGFKVTYWRDGEEKNLFETNARTLNSVVNDGNGSKELTLTRYNGTSGTSGFGDTFVIGGYEGTAPSISGNKLTVSGTGMAGIVSNRTSNGYVIDTDTTTIAYGVVDVQSYPKTWDFTNVGTLTTTLDNLAEAVANGTQATWYKNTEDPNYVNLTNYKTWAASDEGYQLNTYYQGIQTVTFAQGSQLTANGQAIEETKGLGIYLKKSNNYNIDFAQGDGGQDYVQFGNGYLKFTDTNSTGRRSYIRIPSVPAGYKVYISASGQSGVGGSPAVCSTTDLFSHHGLILTAAEQNDLASNTDGSTWVYEGADGHDVIIDVTGLTVYKLAVTGTFKNLTDYQGKSYATESRDHNEKYDLSGYFTGNEIAAFKVTGYAEAEKGMTIDDEENKGMPLAGKLTLEPVEVAPASTGVILQGEGTGFTGMPLFVKDVNTNEDNIGLNYMVPSSQTANNPYILAMTYSKLDENGQPTGEKKSGPLAFYKMVSGSLGANKAYFDMPETSSEDPQTVTVNGSYTFNPTTLQLTSTNQVKSKSFGDDHVTIAFDDLVEIGNQTKYFVGGSSTDAYSEYYLKVRTANNVSSIINISGKDGAKVTGITFNGIDKMRNISYTADDEATTVTSTGENYNWLSNWNGEADAVSASFSSNWYTKQFTVNYTYETTASSGNANNFFMFTFIDGDEELNDTDAIERIELAGQGADVMAADAVYYNLNGQQLQGKPTQRGIYICNGKKVYVK